MHHVGLDALHGPVILHMQPASVHCTVVSVFMGAINSETFRLRQYLKFKPRSL